MWRPGPPASVSILAVSFVAPAAVEGAWPPVVSVAPQTAYAQEGLAGLAWRGVQCNWHIRLKHTYVVLYKYGTCTHVYIQCIYVQVSQVGNYTTGKGSSHTIIKCR